MDKQSRYLAVYLADHHAGSVAARRLTDRIASENRGDPLADFLRNFRGELDEDRMTLERVMETLGLSPSKVKDGLALLGSEIGRAKLNGQVRGYSPLSRLLEIESLMAGVQAKQALWDTLAVLGLEDKRLATFDFGGLHARAAAQLDRLTEWHRRAAEQLETRIAPPRARVSASPEA